MGKMVENSRFLAEQFKDHFIARKFGKNDFDCDRIARLNIMSLEDFAHSANADERVNSICLVELGPNFNRGTSRDNLGPVISHEITLGPIYALFEHNRAVSLRSMRNDD